MAKPSGKYSLALIVVLLIALVCVKFFKSCTSPAPENESTVNATHERTNIDERTEWRYRSLVYTKHAKCRMSCRNISESEVVEIQHNGTVNYQKSDLKDKPCSSYAVEGKTNDGQKVRIVFGACQKITTVITCIDLGVEHVCDCK